MRRHLRLHADPMKIKITPYGFHKYANDYLMAAENWPSKGEYSPVPYFMTCRSIELGLKAYLLGKGKKLDEVKKDSFGHNGHDIEKGLKTARLNSLDELIKTNDSEEKHIRLANNYYKTKGFEYFFIMNHAAGLTDLPDLEILKKYSSKLLENIKTLTDNTDAD